MLQHLRADYQRPESTEQFVNGDTLPLHKLPIASLSIFLQSFTLSISLAHLEITINSTSLWLFHPPESSSPQTRYKAINTNPELKIQQHILKACLVNSFC